MKTPIFLSSSLLLLLAPVEGQVGIQCFTKSKEQFGTPPKLKSTEFSHVAPILSTSMNSNMRVGAFKGCRNSSNTFTGIQFTLSDFSGADGFELREVGNVSSSVNCDTVTLGESDYISSMIVGWDNKRVTSVAFLTSNGVQAVFGAQSIRQSSFTFDPDENLIGLYGTQGSDGIATLGSLVYMPECGGADFPELMKQADQERQEERDRLRQEAQDRAQGTTEPDPQEESKTDTGSNDISTGSDTVIEEPENDETSADRTEEQDDQYVPGSDIITDSDAIAAQFSQFEPLELPEEGLTAPDTQEAAQELVESVTQEPMESQVAEDEESSPIVPILVGVVLLIAVVVTCVVCIKLAKRKRQGVKTEVEQKPEGETPRTLMGTEPNQVTDEENGVGAPITEANLVMQDQEISVEVQQHEERGDHNNQDLLAVAKKAEEFETKSTPEVQHPAVTNTLETIDEMQNEGTVAASLMPSALQSAVKEHELRHPPAEGEAVYTEEESSMPAINLKQTSPLKPNNEQDASAMLPVISENRGQNLFSAETPDTRGVPVKRFQEIIDSDDETNGNGSRVQRIGKKKFRNQRDVFGAEVDQSESKINFPINEQEGENEDEVLKGQSPQQHIESQTTLSNNTSQVPIAKNDTTPSDKVAKPEQQRRPSGKKGKGKGKKK